MQTTAIVAHRTETHRSLTCHCKDADDDADVSFRQHHVFRVGRLPSLRLPCCEHADEEDDEIEGNDDHERPYVQVPAVVSRARSVGKMFNSFKL